MLLLPQHMQWQEHHRDLLSAARESLCTPFAWGLVECNIQIDHEVRVTHLVAVLPDGTLVVHQAKDARQDLSLVLSKSRFNESKSLFLDVPPYKENGRLVAQKTSGETTPGAQADPGTYRFTYRTEPVSDISTGMFKQDVDVLALNPTLQAAEKNSDTRLRLASVQLDNNTSQAASILYDGVYMRLPTNSLLFRRLETFQRELHGTLSGLQADLQGMGAHPSIAMTYTVMSGQAYRLDALMLLPYPAPWEIYLALCEMYGAWRGLLISRGESLSKDGPLHEESPPKYDHADQLERFDKLLEQLHKALEKLGSSRLVFEFEATEGGFQLKLTAFIVQMLQNSEYVYCVEFKVSRLVQQHLDVNPFSKLKSWVDKSVFLVNQDRDSSKEHRRKEDYDLAHRHDHADEGKVSYTVSNPDKLNEKLRTAREFLLQKVKRGEADQSDLVDHEPDAVWLVFEPRKRTPSS